MGVYAKDFIKSEDESGCKWYEEVYLRPSPYCHFLRDSCRGVEKCPLIEVHEPHGRTIDADALVEDLKRQCEEVFKIDAVSPDDFWITRDQAYNEKLWKTWCESFFEYLKTRETIIQASEEGE